MKVECPRCHTHVEKPLHGDPVCPTCGFGAPAGTTAPGSPQAATPPPQATASPQSMGSPPGGMSNAGWEQTGTPASAPKQGMAITALVLGILGCCAFGLLTALPAAIIGGIAMNKAKKDPQQYGGHGMALTGMILGIIGTVASIIVLALYAAVIVAVLQGDLPPECLEDPDSVECEQALDEGESSQATHTLWMPALVPFGRLVVPQADAG